MPLLVEAMPNGLIFPYESRGKQTEWPNPQSSGHPCRGVAAVRTNPDCQRCALSPPSGRFQGAFVVTILRS